MLIQKLLGVKRHAAGSAPPSPETHLLCQVGIHDFTVDRPMRTICWPARPVLEGIQFIMPLYSTGAGVIGLVQVDIVMVGEYLLANMDIDLPMIFIH